MPMHPGEVIDISRGGNQTMTPGKKTWTGNTETYSLVFREHFRNTRGKNFQNFHLAPPKPQKEAHFWKIRDIYSTKFSVFCFRKFCGRYFKNLQIFQFSIFLCDFYPRWPFPNQQFLCGFQKLQSHSSCCKNLGRTNLAESLGWQTLTWNELCPVSLLCVV